MLLSWPLYHYTPRNAQYYADIQFNLFATQALPSQSIHRVARTAVAQLKAAGGD